MTNEKTGKSKAVRTLLVVENEILVRMAIASFLRECGYRVLEASNGTEARLILESGTGVDLVFAEADLPGDINGFALAHWIRGAKPGVQVMLTSGNAAMAKMAHDVCEKDSFVKKPYSHEELTRQIRGLLSRLD